MRQLRFSTGDTLVEVLLSTVVLSIIITGSYTLSNRANRLGQSAIERTEVAGQMQEYTEVIRTMRARDSGGWDRIVDKASTGVSDMVEVTATGPVCKNPTDGFVLNYDAILAGDFGVNSVVDTPSDVDLPGGAFSSFPDSFPNDLFAVWGEAKQDGAGTVDVHVRACWEGIGDQPLLYDTIVLRLDNEE